MADQPSLLNYFTPPEEYRGLFGWLCGYTATAYFLDQAAEHFLEQTNAQRRFTGRVALAAMLDPGVYQITPVDAPGVAHLPMKSISPRPFKLLHAKVALLGFRHVAEPDRWLVRLIVSTGNWTSETLENTLDLVWALNVPSTMLTATTPEARLARADIARAWDMFGDLRKLFDGRLIEQADRKSETFLSFTAFNYLLKAICDAPQVAVSRFFDNRDLSLLNQLPRLVHKIAGKTRRNYLCMGSGFFESGPGGRVPSVLRKIDQTLKDKGLTTATADVNLFVNPRACQSIARSMGALTDARWTVRPAFTSPEIFGPKADRDLHAKFIFGANGQDRSPNCSSPFLYLGSGNLTGAGFTEKTSAFGNLECGVVLAPGNLTWDQLSEWLLPIQFDAEFDSTGDGLSAGHDMPEHDPQFFAAPIACLRWRTGEHGNMLEEIEPATLPYDVLDGSGQVVKRNGDHYFWADARPLQVEVKWTEAGEKRSALVPVVDEFGRVAASSLPEREVEEAWWDLDSFPNVSSGEDGSGDGDDPDGGIPSDDERNSSAPREGRYPIRDLMQLVERIADKQETIGELEWPLWCARLIQCLSQVSASPSLAHFKALGINPLSPLMEKAFRPAFANRGRAREQYEEALRALEARWGVANLKGIGGE